MSDEASTSRIAAPSAFPPTDSGAGLRAGSLATESFNSEETNTVLTHDDSVGKRASALIRASNAPAMVDHGWRGANSPKHLSPFP